jgi:acyl-CoA thioesterase FadM
MSTSAPDGAFAWSGAFPLRWRDLDLQGHLYHAVHVTLLDEGRASFLESAWGRRADEYVVAHLEIDYRSEATLEDGPITVHLQTERVGTTSISLRESLRTADGRLVADGRAVLVAWDRELHRPRALESWETEALLGRPTGAAQAEGQPKGSA